MKKDSINKKKRKSYIKPLIKTEKIFEQAALACGKCISGNPIYRGTCRYVPRLS